MSKLTQRWQLVFGGVLSRVQDVVISASEIHEHWSFDELVTLVNAVLLLGLRVCAVSFGLNLHTASGGFVGNVNLRTTFGVKALAVKDCVCLVDVARHVVQVG